MTAQVGATYGCSWVSQERPSMVDARMTAHGEATKGSSLGSYEPRKGDRGSHVRPIKVDPRNADHGEATNGSSWGSHIRPIVGELRMAAHGGATHGRS